MELKTRQKAAYGVGAIGKDMVYSLVASYLLVYFNDILGINGAFIGVMFMAARVFDAFNDPFMGVIVEKTHTRFGKFRPWIFLGTLLNALVLIGIFTIPSKLSGNALLVFITIGYILWGVTYTLMDIPFWSMIPAITKSGKSQRESFCHCKKLCRIRVCHTNCINSYFS
jgi:Na+/melibiose symporter and related transporters